MKEAHNQTPYPIPGNGNATARSTMCSFGSREFLLLIIFPFLSLPKTGYQSNLEREGLYKGVPHSSRKRSKSG
ncbi:hypothetical protein CEXT_516111 [Caerostris extrusa]|uniref:Uncharacterized protein n=1 Tax=Caerostris extrusa TaxID=172846 RepID=A0AAV4T9U2_CAEEX|nr:hypothetical protein CEXT_516111 [Caerostris extrusa]